MASNKKCKKCGMPITGKIKIISYRKKLGKKSLLVVDMYDEKCFNSVKKEGIKDEPTKQKRPCKRKNKKRT